MRQFAELAGDVRDPYPMFAGIRADTPVMEVHFGTGSGGRYRHDEKAPRITSLFTVTSHELAQQVLTDNVRFSSAANAMTIGQVMGRTILEMDPPEHQRHRALVAKAFRTRVLDQWSDTIIGATVSELIDAFASDGHADLIPQLTFPFPVRVIARILGLPEADWPRFLRLSTELIAVMRNWDRAVAASRELRGYFAEIIADRRRHPRDDLVSQLIEAEVDGHRLSDDEIYPFLLLLLPAGAETTYRSSSNLLFGLLSEPGPAGRGPGRPGPGAAGDRGGAAVGDAAAHRGPDGHPGRGTGRRAHSGGRLRGRVAGRGEPRPAAVRRAGRLRHLPGGQAAHLVRRRSAQSAWACTWPGWRCGCC